MKTPPSASGFGRAAALAGAATMALAVFAQTPQTLPAEQPPGTPPPPIPAATPPGPATSAPGRNVEPLRETTPAPVAPGTTESQDFAAVDTELAGIERRLREAPSEHERDSAKVRYATLKDRRDELKRDFNRAKFELFKSDVSNEAKRISTWSGAAETKTGTAVAHPSVGRLEIDLKLLRSRASTLSDESRKSELTRRLDEFEKRRDVLTRRYDEVEFEALQRDIEAEWKRLKQ